MISGTRLLNILICISSVSKETLIYANEWHLRVSRADNIVFFFFPLTEFLLFSFTEINNRLVMTTNYLMEEANKNLQVNGVHGL